MKETLKTFTMLLPLMLLPLSASASPFINEMHYDNVGGDTNEGIEIAGTAGTDLNGWSIVLYNGGDGQSYMTISLSGAIPNQQNGFGTLAFLQSGIQNGANDGMALVDAGANVVQFLSYEGSFTATDGPALGLLSMDIGVAEDTSTPVGASLQLMGFGSDYSGFTWSGPDPNTFGAVNQGQTFVPIPGAAWLLGSGVIGVLGMRRRYRK